MSIIRKRSSSKIAAKTISLSIIVLSCILFFIMMRRCNQPKIIITSSATITTPQAITSNHYPMNNKTTASDSAIVATLGTSPSAATNQKSTIEKLPLPKPTPKNLTQKFLQSIKKEPTAQEQSLSSMKISQATQLFLANLSLTQAQAQEEAASRSELTSSLNGLKYMSYERRISKQLDAAWRRWQIHNKYHRIPRGSTQITFSIHPTGYVSDLKITQPSGSKRLDKIILNCIQSAAPYPPLPRHIKERPYRTIRTFNVGKQNPFQ